MRKTLSANTNFDGLEAAAFENRHAQEMAALIVRYSGVPRVAPALREQPLEQDAAQGGESRDRRQERGARISETPIRKL